MVHMVHVVKMVDEILTTAEISDAFYYGTGVKLVQTKSGFTQEIFDIMTLATAVKELKNNDVVFEIRGNKAEDSLL